MARFGEVLLWDQRKLTNKTHCSFNGVIKPTSDGILPSPVSLVLTRQQCRTEGVLYMVHANNFPTKESHFLDTEVELSSTFPSALSSPFGYLLINGVRCTLSFFPLCRVKLLSFVQSVQSRWLRGPFLLFQHLRPHV